MSNQAIVDPVELMKFANQLENYVKVLEEQTNGLSSSFSHLSNTWKDANQARFEEKYRELTSVMGSFKQNASEQIPALRYQAQKIAEYLGISL